MRFGLALAAPAAALLALAGCSLTTGSSAQPTVAHIVVDGTAPSGSLELVVSTNFYEVQDTVTGVIRQVFNSADTLSITLPYDDHVQLGDPSKIAVHLKNVSASDVTVHMQVGLDNGQGYDHQATLPQGQELVYVYVFTPSVFG
ncbi:MAG: hypothetical protein LJF04_16670 [Gemmatimonadetes bacterium]|nr:hypothetical protein [Gemmatimonadota bacterium]